MALVLVRGGVIACSHSGRLRLTAGDPRLSVDGNGAVTLGREAGLHFGSPVTPVPGMLSPCTAQSPPPAPPQTYVPCVTAPATSGRARKLTVGDKPVLLDTARGTTASGAGPGTWSVSSAGQKKLEST